MGASIKGMICTYDHLNFSMPDKFIINTGRIPVVIDCSHMYHLDYTAAAQFTDMMQEFSSRQQEIFWLSPNMRVSQTLKSVAGDMFIRISNPHEILEDQRDGN